MKSEYQVFKLWWLAVLPLTKDAIHVYIGFLCLLVALILLRRRLEASGPRGPQTGEVADHRSLEAKRMHVAVQTPLEHLVRRDAGRPGVFGALVEQVIGSRQLAREQVDESEEANGHGKFLERFAGTLAADRPAANGTFPCAANPPKTPL